VIDDVGHLWLSCFNLWSYPVRRFGVILARLLVGLIGAFFAVQGFYFSKMASSALWYGVFERPDFRENTGDVRIVKITDPDWFWSNVEFYAVVGCICVLIAVAILLPLAIDIKNHLTAGFVWRLKARHPLSKDDDFG
jgi:hypothetical protein